MPYRLVISISEIEELGTCHSVEGLRRNAVTGSVERIDRNILLCAEGCLLPRIGQSIGVVDAFTNTITESESNTTFDVLVVEKYDVLPRGYTFPGVTELVMRPSK
ncbi:hypothetical protein Pelo_13031 [Pelomyxa schiedti]|nr:hypothetical protein Pelo_13031 [Pelomyxa schiedti]